ncbi:unnamed protein product [Lactuca saligna]|uniref:Uncharacterized protein n=1 Tax=Lactuca saligna TaxID=75948 RepID=A0AA35Z181_LACSI|nr:unnamed protein product [Lactuca saligna]
MVFFSLVFYCWSKLGNTTRPVRIVQETQWEAVEEDIHSKATILDPRQTPGPHPHPKCNRMDMPDMPLAGTSPVSKPHRELLLVVVMITITSKAPQTQPPSITVAVVDRSGYRYTGYNETSDGQTSLYGGQGDTTTAQSPPPASGVQSGYVQPPPLAAASYRSYGAQPPSGYGGYGQKPPVTPPDYGQPPPHQSPNSSPQGGGYAQPAPYSGYGQADASGQRPPYGGAAARYGHAAYGQHHIEAHMVVVSPSNLLHMPAKRLLRQPKQVMVAVVVVGKCWCKC